MKPAKCLQCGYTFYDPVELNKYFVYIEDKPYCIECLKKDILLAETVEGATEGAVPITEETDQ